MLHPQETIPPRLHLRVRVAQSIVRSMPTTQRAMVRVNRLMDPQHQLPHRHRHQLLHQLVLLLHLLSLHLLSQHLRLYRLLPRLQKMVFPMMERMALAPGTTRIKGTTLSPLIKVLYQTTAFLRVQKTLLCLLSHLRALQKVKPRMVPETVQVMDSPVLHLINQTIKTAPDQMTRTKQAITMADRMGKAIPVLNHQDQHQYLYSLLQLGPRLPPSLKVALRNRLLLKPLMPTLLEVTMKGLM